MGVTMEVNQVPSVFEDRDTVVSVQNALRFCNPELLLDVLLDTEAGWGTSYRDVGQAAKDSLLEKLSSTLALMVSSGEKCANPPRGDGLTPWATLSSLDESCGLGSCQEIIVPFETFAVSDDAASFVRRLNARIFDCSRLEEAMRVIQGKGGKIRMSPGSRSPQWLIDEASPFDVALETGLLQDIEILEDEPWSTTMQRKIWLPRVYCERERYCILANVFWAITYTGFFGAATEKILGDQRASCIEKTSFESFDQSYRKRMFEIAALLNYNGWVDSIESMLFLCDAA